ncbi:uncharacterized protein LOC127805526 [Diospyros lotus]|uniref:uncharacterized protein LOC127805526 n=1 Tax=Diospyros lotus TaxID=55363 RepID=UPI00224CF82B|nr:uncharacterized protein LOC127805526 [Diospyros lotus]
MGGAIPKGSGGLASLVMSHASSIQLRVLFPALNVPCPPVQRVHLIGASCGFCPSTSTHSGGVMREWDACGCHQLWDWIEDLAAKLRLNDSLGQPDLVSPVLPIEIAVLDMLGSLAPPVISIGDISLDVFPSQINIISSYDEYIIYCSSDNIDGADHWTLGHTLVSGGEEICIGGQILKVIFSPGHTDGHMALLHASTHSLIVGDHCTGQGSAVLDITSGGNMHEYFQTTYKFIDISPNVLIPMHGRLNLWPKHMLCGYLKNRRSRESVILKAIENGAKTLFDIVAYTYADVDRSLWGHAASNVRLHVDHLAKQEKLPKDFSLQKFQTTCGLRFLSYWVFAYLSSFFLPKHPTLRTPAMLGAMAVVGFAMAYSIKHKLHSE